jgi:polysaccharide export outer membrane protein
VSFSSLTAMRPISIAAISSLMLAGCVGIPNSPSNLPKAKQVADAQDAQSAYLMQVGDVLDIKLMLNPELNDEVTIRPDGKITTTVASDIQAAGRTTSDLEADLDHAYTGQLVKPHVAVIVRSFAPTRVYVTGEVTQPGEFVNVGPNLTLMQAIARAGGLTPHAGPEKVLIVRHGANGAAQAFQADYSLAASGIDLSNDVRLQPYDVVYVPKSDVGNVYLNFNQYIQQFVPVSFGMSYQINPTTTVK